MQREKFEKLISKEEMKITPEEKEKEKPFDAVIVYGVGPQPIEKIGYPSTIGQRMNVEAAAWLYQNGRVRRIIVTGGKSGGEQAPTEAEAMAKILKERFNILERDIILEKQSKNTIENVAFISNLVDRKPKQLENLLHLGIASHKERIETITACLDLKGRFISGESVLEKKDPKKWKGQILPRMKELPVYKERLTAEPIWQTLLEEVPVYWLPQAARVDSLNRFRSMLTKGQVKDWLKDKFNISEPEKLIPEQIKELKEKIIEMKEIRDTMVKRVKTLMRAKPLEKWGEIIKEVKTEFSEEWAK